MSTGELITVNPSDLIFQFELYKQISSSLQLTNMTDNHVAYKVKTTNPKKYCVRPNTGVLSPRSTCEIIVTMQARKEAPPDMQCKDKFLLQSLIASPGVTAKDITSEMFTKESGNVVEECKLRVIYAPPTPSTSSTGQRTEEVVSSNGLRGSRTFVDSPDKSSEVRSPISKLTEEKNAAIEQSNRIRQELGSRTLVDSPDKSSEVRSSILKSTEEKNAAIEQTNRNRQEMASRTTVDSPDKSLEVRSVISKLTEDKNAAIEQSNRIRQELDLLKRRSNKNRGGGVPLMFVVTVGLIGLILGHIMKK